MYISIFNFYWDAHHHTLNINKLYFGIWMIFWTALETRELGLGQVGGIFSHEFDSGKDACYLWLWLWSVSQRVDFLLAVQWGTPMYILRIKFHSDYYKSDGIAKKKSQSNIQTHSSNCSVDISFLITVSCTLVQANGDFVLRIAKHSHAPVEAIVEHHIYNNNQCRPVNLFTCEVVNLCRQDNKKIKANTKLSLWWRHTVFKCSPAEK